MFHFQSLWMRLWRSCGSIETPYALNKAMSSTDVEEYIPLITLGIFLQQYFNILLVLLGSNIDN